MKRQDPGYAQFLPDGGQGLLVPYRSKQCSYLLRVQYYRGGQITNSQTVDVNNPQVSVASGPSENPLLVFAFDIDPLFIVLNKVSVAMGAKADLVGAGVLMEPPQVERLEACFTSS